MSDIIGHCWHCGAELTTSDFGRESNCLRCGKPTRSCRNCRFYARGRPNDCSEPVAEPVADKERANFCGWFDPAPSPERGDAPAPADALRKAAEDLFKS